MQQPVPAQPDPARVELEASLTSGVKCYDIDGVVNSMTMTNLDKLQSSSKKASVRSLLEADGFFLGELLKTDNDELKSESEQNNPFALYQVCCPQITHITTISLACSSEVS
jgi:hypothetical protein